MRLNHLIELTLIASCGAKARVTILFLRRFKADWATEAYLHRSLRNRKGHLSRREAKRKATGIDIDVTLDDDDDDEPEVDEGGGLGEVGDE
jgi:hypothetical protein